MRSGLKSAAAALLLTLLAALPTVAQDAKGRSSAPPPAPAGGSGRYFRIDYPASTDPAGLQTPVSYLLWIPDGVTQLRGLIVHQHGAGTTASIEGSTGAYDLHWQALAKKWDCALWSPSYHVQNQAVDLTPGGSEHWFDPRRGSEKTFLKALDDFAAKSGQRRTGEGALDPLGALGRRHLGRRDDHAAPGARRGGLDALRLGGDVPLRGPSSRSPGPRGRLSRFPRWATPARRRPARTPARWPRSSSIGEGGARSDSRPTRGPATSAATAATWPSRTSDACMAMRLPDKGSKDQTLKPVDMSNGWLAKLVEKDPRMRRPSRRLTIRAMSTRRSGCPTKRWPRRGSSTSRPAPWATRLRRPLHSTSRRRRARTGVEVTWNAEADFESGIRNFIVLRDGQELASVPEKPVGRFGRPLFQS